MTRGGGVENATTDRGVRTPAFWTTSNLVNLFSKLMCVNFWVPILQPTCIQNPFLPLQDAVQNVRYTPKCICTCLSTEEKKKKEERKPERATGLPGHP